MKLNVEINTKFLKGKDTLKVGNTVIMYTPPLNEDYWIIRVKVSDTQAIVGFPKFGLVGIGFAVEDADWNTNLPSGCEANQIFNHIKENKGDDLIPDERCIKAIRLVQKTAKMFANTNLN